MRRLFLAVFGAVRYLGLKIVVSLVVCFSSLSANADLAYLAYANGYWQVWLYDPGSQKSRQITHTAYDKNRVSWYPDGSRLFVNSTQGRLSAVDISTGSETKLQLPHSEFYDAVISPDGKRMTFSYSATGEPDDGAIWVANIESRAMSKLSNMSGLQHSPQWSSTGAGVFFVSNSADQTSGLWYVDIASGALTQLLSNRFRNFDPVGAFYEPNAEADKNSMEQIEKSYAYATNQSGNYDIWLKSEGGIKNVTLHPGSDTQPAFSADNRFLYFTSTRDTAGSFSGTPNIWRLELRSGQIQRVTTHERGARNPVWCP